MQINEKLRIIVRSDISFGLGVAQACHAARQFAEEHHEIEREWFTTSNHIAVLGSGSEIAFNNLLDKLSCSELKFSVFYEPDLNGTPTAIAIEPSHDGGKLCSKFKLYGS